MVEPRKVDMEFLAASLAGTERSWIFVAAALFRARLSALVLVTAIAGYYLGTDGLVDGARLLHTVLGTALVAGSASALNQWWEREPDARMRRTQTRPLPTGRLRPGTVLGLGLVGGAAGLALLALAVNPLTSVLGAVSLLIYLLIYTPLKRRTWLNTAVGTISGAMPVLMGWTASRGTLNVESWVLFGILVFWQLPHFLAIAWIYREDYERAGFRMLPVLDPQGRRTGRQAVAFAMALVACSAGPYVLRVSGPLYAGGALLLGLGFVGCAVQFQREVSVARARRLFRASVWYLSLLFGLMVADKVNVEWDGNVGRGQNTADHDVSSTWLRASLAETHQRFHSLICLP